MISFPIYYGSQRVTIDQLERKSTFANCHPVMRRRLKDMLIASNGHVGIGTAWRSPATQDAEVARRDRLRRQGQHPAMAAPSGKSWHCAGAAADLVGDLHWAAAHCESFGLIMATWGGESWHFQPKELPHARPLGADPSRFLGEHRSTPVPMPVNVPAPRGWPPFNPGAGQFSLWPFAPAKPSVRLGAHGDAVMYLQGVLKKNGLHITVCDGIFGSQTRSAVLAFQRTHRLTTDGWIGSQGWPVVDRAAG